MLVRVESELLAPPHVFAGLRRRFYRAVAADVPMRFKSYAPAQLQPWNTRRDNERHYKTMPFEEIAALPVKDLASPDGCHLFYWTSGPFIPQALKIIAAWGFKYSTRAFTWAKARPSWDGVSLLDPSKDFPPITGHTVRHQTELVLLARRGNCRRKAKDVDELIIASRRQHSRKPDEFFRRVEHYCDGPYCELFARSRRFGWDVWGDQIDRFPGEQMEAFPAEGAP